MTKEEFTLEFLKEQRKEQYKKKKTLEYEINNFKLDRRLTEWKKKKKH